LYYTTTAAAAPTAGNLVAGELAINTNDGKLFYKDSSGVVQTIASKGAGTIGGSTTQVQYNLSGALAGSANMVFNGTTLTVADLTDSSLTSGRVTYAGASGNLVDSANLAFTGTQLTLAGNQIISVTDNSNAALRVTQLGTGNALLVEDSTNPDATPFVVANDGSVFKGYTTSIPVEFNLGFQINGTGADSGFSQTRWAANTGAPILGIAKSRGASVATRGIVQSGDSLGTINFYGDDGTNFITASRVSSEVDGTPGTNDMPGRLVFSTTADGASTPTERMRIDNAGKVGIGTSTLTNYDVRIVRLTTGAIDMRSLSVEPTFQSGVTSSGFVFSSRPQTAAAAFTLTNLTHFSADQNTFGAGSTVTNQVGFSASSTLTGATNDYGFYGNLAAATGVYNLYMAGSADNFLQGKLGIGQNFITNAGVGLVYNSGTSSTLGFYNATTIDAVTTTYQAFVSFPATVASAFTVTNLLHYVANQNTFGASSAVTTQAGFRADGNMVGATNNYGFQGNIASGTGRYNLYMLGTADNYLGGNLGIGALPTVRLQVNQASAGTAIAAIYTGSTGGGAEIKVSNGYSSTSPVYAFWFNNDTGLGNPAAQTASIITSATERMRIDSVGNVGIGATANASALLDVQSTTKGVRMPNMTTAQKNAIASPAAGLMVFDTTLAKLCVYSGAAWQTITST
jgi:hypothetical protein